MKNLKLHNERVLHVLARLMDVVSSEAAIKWMLDYNRTLWFRPIQMIDDDALYDLLVRAVAHLESGEPI